MSSQLGAGDFSPGNKRLFQLQFELKQAEERGDLAEDDPIVKQLFLESFHDDENAFTLISGHEGKISTIVSQLDQLGVTPSKIITCCEKILDVKKSDKPAGFASPSLSVSKPATLAFMCDIDSPDHNGVIFDFFEAAIASESSVITTRTLFHSSKNRRVGSEPQWKSLDEHYEIYSNGPYLIFVPKKPEEGLTAQARVEKLDLNWGALQKVTLEEAWCPTDDRASMEGFRTLFSGTSTHEKFIAINGHGGIGCPAGLTAEHYKQFLEWTESQRCKGLLVSSCYSGGASALHHLPKKDPKSQYARQVIWS